MKLQVAHAMCKQGCRLISDTANLHIVTIGACYNCPRSTLGTLAQFYCKFAYLSDVRLQGFDAVQPQHKPQLQRPEAATKMDLPMLPT